MNRDENFFDWFDNYFGCGRVDGGFGVVCGFDGGCGNQHFCAVV